MQSLQKVLNIVLLSHQELIKSLPTTHSGKTSLETYFSTRGSGENSITHSMLAIQ